MKILVIGGGGREHALVWKLRQSQAVEHVWCAPGNGGISGIAECIPAETGDIGNLRVLAEGLRPDLTVVGPELPLVLGLADELRSRGLCVVGPSRAAAEVEGSKCFAKEFMQRYEIPTAAAYGIFDSPVDAYAALCAVDWPVVVKADGLCGGKGVLVTHSPDEATQFIDRLMVKGEFGEAGRRIILEEGLIGKELSYIVLTDGENIIPLAPVRDHKRAYDGDQGPNTGGMGAYCVDTLLGTELESAILKEIVRPTIRGLAAEDRNYNGFLYFGLMLTAEGPRVLEFNCRLGDPEAQALILRMDFDLAELLAAMARESLGSVKPRWNPAASVCVVLAARGYPERPEIGRPIEGLTEADSTPGAVVFHAGTRRVDARYYTNGGRVVGVSATGNSLERARELAYRLCSTIRFSGCFFRSDIGGAWQEGLAGEGTKVG